MTGTRTSGAGRLLLTLAAALLLTLTLPLTARAGDGTFADGRYNFTVSVRFNATEVQLRQIEETFRRASHVLYDATDGQHQFGRITIVNNDGPRFTEDGCFTAPSEASNMAEYWIEPQAGRAHAPGRYGIHGQHVMLYFSSNFQQRAGADGDAYTIAHEHGHHAYDLGDEYSGPMVQGAECAAEADTPALNFCLMDNYFVRGGRCPDLNTCPGVYTLNEFCVVGNHDPDRDTFQEARHSASCWETIGRHLRHRAAPPQGLPVDDPPPAGTVEFPRVGGNLRVILVIDRSASMADNNRMTYAKAAAKTLVNLLRAGDTVGLVSYSSSATLDLPLARIASPDVNDPARASIKSAVDALTPSGGTFIADGLRTAVSHFAAQPERSANEVVILVSDGNNNTGDAPSSAIPALRQPPGVPVMALLVGPTLSGQMTLKNIAGQTGGKFFLVGEPENLERLMLITQAESSHAGLVSRGKARLAPGEVREFPAFIEAGARAATFGVAVQDGAADVTLSLRTPSGRTITAADAPPGSNVRYSEESFGKAFQVCAPEAGTWAVIVTNGGSARANVQAYAFSEQDGVELAVSAPLSLPTFPEVVELQASPTYRGERVVGAVVIGAAVRPDGSRIALTFHDDGLPEHGDAVADDGIYGARFSRYNANGTYTFDVQVTNFAGTTYAGESLFAFAPSNAKPVPQFTRISSATVVVSGVPAGIQEADLAVTATATPDPVLTGSNVVYTFNVTNNGPQTASAVKLTTNLPPQVALVSCVATGGGVCGGPPANPTVTFASLASGASQTVRLTAKVNCAVADGTQLAATATVSSQATDFEPGNNSATVAVRASNPPPVISGAAASPSALWPPNHKMVGVKVNYKVTDNCGPAVTRLSVSSNEPVNGTGDGDTAPDWEVVNDRLVRLRAERAGNGAGRTYTITITATDSAGQSSSRQVTVTVPKSQKK